MRWYGYLHEVWLEADGEACYPLGPAGDNARALSTQPARLIWIFWADSHFEAMTIYNQFLGREEYDSLQAWDHQPYPDDWYHEQDTYLGGRPVD